MTALIAKTYTADSLWADLGGTYEQKSFDRKVQALTNPTGYAADRKTELDRIKAAAESAFTTSYRGFQDAGLSPDASKAAAYQSAQAEYQNQMRVFTLMFGQGTDAVYQTQAGYVRTGAVRNVMSAAPSRRAPAKRRRRKK